MCCKCGGPHSAWTCASGCIPPIHEDYAWPPTPPGGWESDKQQKLEYWQSHIYENDTWRPLKRVSYLDQRQITFSKQTSRQTIPPGRASSHAIPGPARELPDSCARAPDHPQAAPSQQSAHRQRAIHPRNSFYVQQAEGSCRSTPQQGLFRHQRFPGLRGLDATRREEPLQRIAGPSKPCGAKGGATEPPAVLIMAARATGEPRASERYGLRDRLGIQRIGFSSSPSRRGKRIPPPRDSLTSVFSTGSLTPLRR
jgi:hypothetical protein